MTIEDIERAVERLEGDDFARFRDWFSRLAEDRFDRAIEDDVLSGRLDALLDEAGAEDRAERTTPL
jgi:hypothetical protein